MEQLYQNHLFPAVLDWVMRNKAFEALRSELLSGVGGRILEIGFGTGLSLEHFPPEVCKVEGLDIAPSLLKKAQERIAQSAIEVVEHHGTANHLPFEDHSFDTVVCSWTLCSVDDIDGTLREIKRVLKRSGVFRFIEHGAHPNPKVRGWQDKLNPWQVKLAGGCNLNRDFKQLLLEQGFGFEQLQCWEEAGLPAFLGYQYMGSARVLFE